MIVKFCFPKLCTQDHIDNKKTSFTFTFKPTFTYILLCSWVSLLVYPHSASFSLGEKMSCTLMDAVGEFSKQKKKHSVGIEDGNATMD